MNTTGSRLSVMIVALVLASSAAHGQNSAVGRSVFAQKNCTQCHAYEARGLGPSVREMKGRLKGDIVKASAALTAAFGHGDDLKTMSRDDIRAVSEWLAGIPTGAPPPDAIAPAAPETKPLAVDSAATKREAAAKAKRDAQEKARQAAEARAQARKDAVAKAKLDAEAKAQARLDAEAQRKREAAARRDQAEFARRDAEAKARNDSVALEAIKRDNEERVRREAEAQARQEAEARARREADALAAAQKREADERSKQAAEAQAKKDAETLAAQKREAEAKKPEPAARLETAKADSAGRGGRKKRAYRDGSDLPPCAPPTGAPLGAIDEDRAKEVIERVGCPQCHAYVQKKTGTPMKKIYEKYKGDWECVVFRLEKNKTHNEEGVTDDVKGIEFKIVADYIATRRK